MEQAPRPWYQKKRYLISIGLLAFFSLALANSGSQSAATTDAASVNVASPADTSAAQPQQDAQVDPSIDTADTSADDSSSVDSPVDSSDDSNTDAATVSNDSTYTNTDGNQIPSPVPLNDCASSGGTAICSDGSCSFSAHRSGTCSHHGGVSQWL